MPSVRRFWTGYLLESVRKAGASEETFQPWESLWQSRGKSFIATAPRRGFAERTFPLKNGRARSLSVTPVYHVEARIGPGRAPRCFGSRIRCIRHRRDNRSPRASLFLISLNALSTLAALWVPSGSELDTFSSPGGPNRTVGLSNRSDWGRPLNRGRKEPINPRLGLLWVICRPWGADHLCRLYG